jgi:hypothetical protein
LAVIVLHDEDEVSQRKNIHGDVSLVVVNFLISGLRKEKRPHKMVQDERSLVGWIYLGRGYFS